jgi:hypothetical protein
VLLRVWGSSGFSASVDLLSAAEGFEARLGLDDFLGARCGADDEEAAVAAAVSWLELAFLREDLRFTDSDVASCRRLERDSSEGPEDSLEQLEPIMLMMSE